MNESKYYHSALNSALLNGKNLKARIDARIAVAPAREKKQVRISPRFAIALIAAATFLIASVSFAAVLLRNQIFKEKTNAVLDERIETVSEPLNAETHEGWQPKQIILFDDVMSTKEDVNCAAADGTITLETLSCHGRTELWARFRFDPKNGESFSVTDLSASVNGSDYKKAIWSDPFDSKNGSNSGDRYFANAAFTVHENPFLPGATFSFTGKVNGEPFTLTYTFTEETYQTLQQAAVNSLKEHEQLVADIPDEGTEVMYELDNHTLCEVSVNGGIMYFTETSTGQMSTEPIPYSEYDSGCWPVIDGRVGEYFSLGVVDGPYEEGVVYSTCIPYPEEKRPEESLIAFSGIVFRYEWKTGKVTVPKDKAEYEAWRKESMELSRPYCEEDWIWHLDAKGEMFGIEDLVFHNHSQYGMIGVVLSTEGQFERSKRETAEEAPKVSINGIPLVHYGEVDPHAAIMGYVTKDGRRKGYEMTGAAVADLPKTFTLSVTYRGETVETTLRLSDVIRMDDAYNDVYADAFDY